MKSYIILFVALTMLVKPLWPVAEYIMNYEYIANVLCENKDRPELQCDGKCYLAQMLAEESKQSEKNPFGDKQNIEITQILHLIPTFDLNLESWYNNANTNNAFSKHLKSFLLTFKIVQPPEIS